MKLKFYVCEHCGNVITFVEDKGVPVMCCGQKMTQMMPNVTDAAGEKHVPVCEVDGNFVSVCVGEVEHPMAQEHHIGWVALETKQGCQIKMLDKDKAPKAQFMICDGDEVEDVYAYCNLHGLWKK